VGDDAVDGMEVFADVGGMWDGQETAFEGGTEVGKEFAFELLGKGAEFDAAASGRRGHGRGRGRNEFTELLNEDVAEADAGACVIEADAAGKIDARRERFNLLRGGGVAEDEDFAGEVGELMIDD